MRRASIRFVILLFVAMLGIGWPAHAQTVDARRVADLEARIIALEEQIRNLVGRVEEAEYRSEETSQRLDRLLADIDARLQGVEPAPGGAQAAPADRPVAAVGAVNPATTAREGNSSSVLGTISRDALLGLPAPPPEPPPADLTGAPRELFDAGMARVKAGDWAGAEAAFASVVTSAPDDPVAANAAYWQAETYYARKEWPQAAASFARNVRTYGADAVRSPDNVLKLGMSLVRMGDRDKACAAFAEFDRRYTNATAALKQMAAREKANAGCSS